MRKMKTPTAGYGRYFSLLVAYLFALSAAYFIFGAINHTPLIFSFPVNPNLAPDPMMPNYSILVIFIIVSLAAFFLHRAGKQLLMHGVSLALIITLTAGMYLNTWFEYQNVFLSAALIIALAAYLAAFIKRAVPEMNAGTMKAAGKLSVWLLALFAAFYAVYFCNLAILRHDLFLSHKFDLAWENQALYNLAFGGIPYTSLGLVENNLADHFSLIYYAVAPFYRLFPHPEFLLVFQVIVIIISAFMVYLLAGRMLNNRLLSAAFAALFLLHPSVQGMMLFDFHPVVMAVPLFLLCYYFIEKGSFKLFLVPFFALFLVREDAAFAAIFIPVFLVAIKKISLRQGLVLLAAALALNGVISVIMDMLGNVKDHMHRFYFLFPSGAGILSLFIINPFFELVQALSKVKLEFIVIFSGPLLFLYFLRKENLLLLFPAFLFTVFSKHTAQYTVGFQYSAILVSFAFYLTMREFSMAETARVPLLRDRGRAMGFMLAVGIVWSLLYGSFFSKSYKLTWLGNVDPVVAADYYYNDSVGCFRDIPGSVDWETVRLLDKIQAKYSVKADLNIMPHVSGRRYLYNVFFDRETDIVIFFNKEPFTGFEKTGFPGKDYVFYRSTKTVKIYVNRKLKDFSI